MKNSTLSILFFYGYFLFALVDLPAQNHFGTVASNTYVQSVLSMHSLDSLQKFVKELTGVLPVTIGGSSITIPHRTAGSSQSRQAAEHIANTFSRFGLSPVLENNVSPYTKLNVVATLPGIRNEYVVLCAHFDSKTGYPGADDNGSGTASLMEAARILSNFSFTYSIRFIAFGGEELGLLGSKEYVNQHGSDSIRAVINCDMIMYDNNANLVMQAHAVANSSAAYSTDLVSYTADVNSTYSLPLTLDIRNPGISASDHSPFWSAARSAVLLIEEYGSDFTPWYHSASDIFSNYTAAKHQSFFNYVSRLSIASIAHLACITSIVPVELLALNVAQEGPTTARLCWTTASETSNAGFIVQRTDVTSMEFHNLGFVAGHGTTTIENSYEYVDTAVPSTSVLYRLKQVDLNGAWRYSPFISFEAMNQRTSVVLYEISPQPANERTTVTYSLDMPRNVRLVLFDVYGRESLLLDSGEQNTGTHVTVFNALKLHSGLYICTLEAGTFTLSQRIIVAR